MLNSRSTNSSLSWINKHIACLAFLVLVFAAPPVAQDRRSQAWSILSAGTKNPSTETRIAAFRALGLLGRDSKAEQTAILALNDKKPEVQVAGVMTLGVVGSDAARAEIKKVMPNADSELLFAGADALYQLKDPAAYEIYYAALTKEKKSGQGLVDSQLKLLQNPKALAKVGFEGGIGFIPFAGLGYGAFKTISKDKESPIRAAAALRLATDRDPKSGAALERAASDEKWLVRAAAIAAIAKRGDSALLKAVIPRLEDQVEAVRFNAAACIIGLSK
jgi:HEAT repeat protein